MEVKLPSYFNKLLILHSDAVWLKFQNYKENCSKWQKQLSDYLGDDHSSDGIDIIIDESDSIAKSIEKHTLDCDLLIVGHRKMSKFKSSLMDSIDEGITNLVSCPVLVVQK